MAATGRLSVHDPNLQNIPIRTPRAGVSARPSSPRRGYKPMSADYSQIELRIMAHLARTPLLDAFRHDRDVHRATAAEVFGVPLEQVTPTSGAAAKAINFGLIYGMSAFGLAKQIGVDRKQAQEPIDTYFARYPGVLAYMERTREQAPAGLCRDPVRPPPVPAGHPRRTRPPQGAERTAINARCRAPRRTS